MTFTWWGEVLEYERGEYNDAALNERTVEVPIAWHFIAQHAPTLDSPRILEVGNVLEHYGIIHSGTIIDLYEQAPGVLNVDILDESIDAGVEYDLIVSISTVEHVHADEPDGPMQAIDRMRALLAPGGWMLATVGLGQHVELDRAIMSGRLGTSRSCTLVRTQTWEAGAPAPIPTGWEQTLFPEWRPYGRPAWAQSVWVGEWRARA